MPLIPDRWLNVSRTNDPLTRRVRVFGNTYSDSSAHLETKDRQGSVQAAASTVVEVWVERFDPARGEDFGWSRETRARVRNDRDVPPPPPILVNEPRANNLLRHREFAALLDENLIDRVFVTPTLWQGQVTLPADAGRGTRYRLAIAEYEEYLIDDDNPYTFPIEEKGRRLVFVEHVELD